MPPGDETDEPSPAAITTLPPALPASVVSPANINTSPPSPLAPVPTRMLTSPPRPPAWPFSAGALPVAIINAPELPAEVVPVDIEISPDTPSVPAFGVRNINGPDDAVDE